MRRLFRGTRYANVTATLALAVALGGTSFAAVRITGRNIKNGSVTGADIKDRSLKGKDVKNSSLTGRDVKNGTLLRKDFKRGQLPAGPKGTTGTRGPKGDTGVVDPSRAGRLAFVKTTPDRTIDATSQAYATATITAPARGLLLAHTSGMLGSAAPASCPCTVQTRLKLDDTASVTVNNLNLGTAPSDYVGGFDRRPTAGAETFVVNAGTHTVAAETFVQQASAFTGLRTSNATLQVVFVPFNGTGATP